jgi:rhodanese-related sulfurtransferase
MAQLFEFASHHPVLIALTLVAMAAVLVYELYARTLELTAISPQDAVRLMNQGAPVLDVRPAEAYSNGHLSNARNLPLEKLSEAAETLKRFKDRPVIVYCERGNTSVAAVRQLTALGFSKLSSLRGGITAWRAENLPLVRS